MLEVNHAIKYKNLYK